MSPQVYKKVKYTGKADIWSLGLIFINLIKLDRHFINPNNFVHLSPKSIAIEGDDRFNLLCHCICSKMVVLYENQRANIDQLIEHEVFHGHFERVDGKAKNWQLNFDLEEIEKQNLKEKIVELKETENELKQKLANERLERMKINLLVRKLEKKIENLENDKENGRKRLGSDDQQLSPKHKKGKYDAAITPESAALKRMVLFSSTTV